MKKMILVILIGLVLVASVSADMIDFSGYSAGESIENVLLGGYVTINSTNADTIVVKAGESPVAYNANTPTVNNAIPNGCLPSDGGISDQSSTAFSDYTFTFEYPVSEFSVKMYDYGDWNYWRETYHEVVLTAYDAGDNPVDTSVLNFTSDTKTTSGNSPEYGFMGDVGDACEAVDGEPGNWTFSVAGDSIAYATLEFTAGTDPAMAFGLFTYERACEPYVGDVRTIGFWKHQFYAALPGGKGKFHISGIELRNMLPITTIDDNEIETLNDGAVIFRTGKKDMWERAVEQCFATQLNYAREEVNDCGMVDVDYDGVPDMTFEEAWEDVEHYYGEGMYEDAKNICDSINNMNH